MPGADLLLAIARIVIGGAFLIVGLRNIGNHELLTGLMRSRGVPLASLSAAVGIGMEIVFGALLVLNIVSAVAALAMALFVVMATAIAHWPFDKTGPERQEAVNACFSNTIMLGGLLALAGVALMPAS